MDSVDICAATSRGDNKRSVNKKNTVWQKRPHLRKTAVQPPTMQSEDKHGPKKIAEEWEQSTVWPSSKKPPQGTQQGQHRTKDSSNTLRFTCSQCRDSLEYVPKDLVKHFEEKHRGSPPVFSCHLCAFRTHEFSLLQVHLLSHKDTFSSCSICNDNVQRTWPEFSAHLTMYHCQNGKYACDMCQKFSTGDVGLFLEHTYAHDLGREQRTEKSLQLLGLEGANDLSLHVKGENKYGPKTTTRSLRCQYCDYTTSHKWLLTRHVKAVHFCRNGNRSKRRKKEEKWTKAFKTDLDDPSEAIASSPQSKPGEELTPSCAAKQMGSKNVDRNMPVVLEGLPSSHQEIQDDTEKSLQLLGLEGANNLSLHVKGENKYGPATTTRSLHCQHCDYATSYKWLLTKHVKAVHFCQNGNQSKKKEEVCSIAMKQNDPVPKIKPRLTRSAVREMCWLTEDCLSLPGREFLDKYCHLSDPQTTLEETQQFLMKSVAGGKGNQKWTKALKSVLSNVPQDMNLHPRSENGIVSNSSDLTVLTVKNKITVAQNGATYAKRLKMMTSSDKETPESTPDDARCIVDQNECQSNLSNHTPCPQTETKLNNIVSMPAHSEPSECTQMQENRENQELKADQEIKEYNKKPEEPMHEDGIDISSELKPTNDSEEQIHKVASKKKRRRRKRKARSRTVAKRSSGVALKIVLKKNPVKEKQWVSQSSLSPSGGGLTDEYHGLPSPHTTTEETVQVLQNKLLIKAHKKWTKASETNLDDPSEAIASSPQSKPGEELTPSCAAKPMGSKNMDRNTPVVLEGLPSTHQEMRDDTEKSLQLLEAEVDESGSACMTGQSDVRTAAGTEVQMCPENVQLRTSGSGTECHVSDNEMSSAADGATPHSSYTKSSPVSQPVITAQGNALISEHSDQSVEVVRDGQVPTDPCPDLLSNANLPAGKAILQDPSPAPVHQRQPFPKNLERILKLVAINPSQLVKRPAGDQPVVVLNHPDADIPEVARIMEVINRYRGEVQKVVLSRRTINALSAMDGKVPETNDSSDAQPDSPGCAENSVQERFMLKLKLRRLSRKKYEVVGAVSPSGDDARKFRCWFCGRAFASEETWMVHRQRHLMEWKGTNCENS